MYVYYRRERMKVEVKRNTATVPEIEQNDAIEAFPVTEMNTPTKTATVIEVVNDTKIDMMTIRGTAGIKEMSIDL